MQPALSRLLVVLVTLGSVTSVIAGEATQTPAPAMLVKKMSRALHELNYEGTFVQVRNGNIESMHILHANDGRGELERMMSLTGEAREVIRTHSKVTCIYPNRRSVVVTNTSPRSALPDIDASLIDNPQYRITLGEPDRVAGYMTHVVDLKPLDTLRYGYRFWIDQSASMLLRSVLLDAHGRSLEEVMFTAIDYLDTVPAERFDVDLSRKRISWSEQLPGDDSPALDQPESSTGQAAAGGTGSSIDRVQFDSLPPGYREVSETYRSMPINEGPVTHVMLSDGVASVSVYVEYVDVSAQQHGALGASSMGAMSAFGLSLPDALITAVGEVPEITVQMIAQAVRLIE